MEPTYQVNRTQFRALLILRNRLVPLPISVDIINRFDRILDSIETQTSLEDDVNLDLFKVDG